MVIYTASSYLSGHGNSIEIFNTIDELLTYIKKLRDEYENTDTDLSFDDLEERVSSGHFNQTFFTAGFGTEEVMLEEHYYDIIEDENSIFYVCGNVKDGIMFHKNIDDIAEGIRHMKQITKNSSGDILAGKNYFSDKDVDVNDIVPMLENGKIDSIDIHFPVYSSLWYMFTRVSGNLITSKPLKIEEVV